MTEEGVGVDKKSKTSGKEKEKNKKIGGAAANKKQDTYLEYMHRLSQHQAEEEYLNDLIWEQGWRFITLAR